MLIKVNRQSSDFASALVKVLGVKPGNETNMGIYAKNSPK